MKKNFIQRRRNIAPMLATFSIIALLVGILFAGSAARSYLQMETFAASGIKTTAKVTDKYRTTGKGPPVNYVHYAFTDQTGKAVAGDDAFPFASWDYLRPGDPVEVTYLPDNPTRSVVTRRISVVMGRDPVTAYTVISIPWIISGGFFAGYLLMKRTAQKKSNG